MAVWYRQSIDGEASEPQRIEPHFDGQTSIELLDAKAKGAHDKGWTVVRTGVRTFTATKERWGGSLCVRDFWAD